MKNNKSCNALKCLKPLGLKDWVNCKPCNGWNHIKCAKLSKTEARSLAEFKCRGCFLVNTIPKCHDDNFRPDTPFNSGVVHLKRVPKKSRIPLAENLILKLMIFVPVKYCLVVFIALLSKLFFGKTTSKR